MHSWSLIVGPICSLCSSVQLRVTDLDLKLEDEKRRTAEANSNARKNEISSNDMKVSLTERQINRRTDGLTD